MRYQSIDLFYIVTHFILSSCFESFNGLSSYLEYFINFKLVYICPHDLTPAYLFSFVSNDSSISIIKLKQPFYFPQTHRTVSYTYFFLLLLLLSRSKIKYYLLKRILQTLNFMELPLTFYVTLFSCCS